jgi:hypothetical protein
MEPLEGVALGNLCAAAATGVLVLVIVRGTGTPRTEEAAA